MKYKKIIISSLVILYGITLQIEAMDEEYIKREMRHEIIFPLELTSRIISSMTKEQYKKFYGNILEKSRNLCQRTLKFFPKKSKIHINFVKSLHLNLLLLCNKHPLFNKKNLVNNQNPWTIENSTKRGSCSSFYSWKDALINEDGQLLTVEKWMHIDYAKKSNNKKEKLSFLTEKNPIYKENKVTLPIHPRHKEKWEFGI